eukprot:CAMPEP_0197891172 /NCGR_PEP_ID=MMETSP1439-20131203/27495_1 /TAXON_ID=66791 /ORGANISM="Gonyaulax spinifera, Strain CCMP409" /LENGTH=52 /DNA_ID=CAMNT_0043511249 /DNA_START=48 /DNA_END=206 /DNA_ORIENTATION=-
MARKVSREVLSGEPLGGRPTSAGQFFLAERMARHQVGKTVPHNGQPPCVPTL